MDQPLRQTSRRAGLGREFNKLWAASAASNLGDGVTLVAAPLLAAALTRDPLLVAGLTFTQRLPWIIFPLLSGVLADRLNRQRAMVAVTIWRSLLIGVLGLATLLGQVSIPLLYVIFFLLSIGETLFDISSATMVPALVRSDQLPSANARLAGTMTVANQFVGPPLGGALFGLAIAVPFLLGAGWIAAGAALIYMLQGSFTPEKDESEPARTVWQDIREGIGWLWNNRLLRGIAITLAILNLTVVAQVAIMVLYAQERLGLEPAGFGLLLTTHAIGAIAGSIVGPRIIRLLKESKVLRVALVIEVAVPAVIALTTSAYVVGGALAFFGLHTMVWGALLVSLRQELTPDRLRGRVESVYRLLEHGAAAPGALIGGVLAASFGLTAPFWFGTGIALAIIPFVWSTFSQRSVNEARESGS
jgi:MFS family permease